MYFSNHPNLFASIDAPADTVVPWKPHALTHSQWPPDYRAVYAWRIQTLAQLQSDPSLIEGALDYYRSHKAEFIQHWMDTYNPRKTGIKWVPFVFFIRQDELIQWLEELDRDQENGLLEKARDMGATWLACAYSVACFILDGDDATGWGSRKQELVDKIGDPDSIFEKMRLLIRRLPSVFLPKGFKTREHATFMKLLNPVNGSTVTGESGDNIGRGGRKKRFFKDESAHYERPEKIESALGDNTNVQIDMSSVNGVGNVFYRRREAGKDWTPGCVIEPGYTRVFVMDWRDHPEKNQEWYDTRKAKAEREGMQHVFAQEVDRDYSASVANRIIDMEWINAAVDAHLHIPALRIPPPNRWMAGLDIADEGLDRNAQALRQWVILRKVEEWGERDPGTTARRSIMMVRHIKGIEVQYDVIGVGSNVKSEYNRWLDNGDLKFGDVIYTPWNAGGEVVNKWDHIIPDDEQSLMNKDFFANFKAQAWWALRTRFYKTYRARMFGDIYPADDLISIDSSIASLAQLKKELGQAVSKPSAGLRTMVDKTPQGTKSPNMADAVVMCYFPSPDSGGTAMVGSYG